MENRSTADNSPAVGTDTTVEKTTRERFRRQATGALGLLALVAVAALGGIAWFASVEQDRLVGEWETRLGLVADSRKAAVENWLNTRRDEMLRLAANRALRYHLIDRNDPELPREEIDASRQYIESVMAAEAERGGYDRADGMVKGGFLLTDGSGGMAAMTPGVPPAGDIRNHFSGPAAPSGQARVSAPFPNGSGDVMVAFATMVLPPEGGGTQPIGRLIGVHPLDPAFFATLEQPGETLRDAQTYLVDVRGDRVRFISPIGDGTPALGRTMMATETDRAAVQLAGQSHGATSAAGHDDTEVLAVSRSIAGTDWTLIRQVDRSAALSDGIRRIWLTAGALILALALVGAMIVAVWRHAVSDRLDRTARELTQALQVSDRLRRLLHNLSNAVPNGITAVDADERVQFSNRAAFAELGIEPEQATGKPLINLLGPAGSAPLHAANATVRKTGDSVTEIDDNGEAENRSVRRRVHVPLDDQGVLIVSEDMTDIVVEREARAAQLDALIDVLVDLIDARDRFAANHSLRVAELSRRMAEAMDLDPKDVHAAETAARLMNLGKLRIDPALLTRSGDLTDDELAQVRDSILHSADLVAGVNFDGPVVETLRQMQERLDGTGRPNGVHGDDLLVTAQIVSLANAYVALISERAHRAARTPAQALDALWNDAETIWRRKVIAALVRVTEGEAASDSGAAEAGDRPGTT